MRSIKKFVLLSLLILASGIFAGCRTPTPPPPSAFVSDWTGLLFSVTKRYPFVNTYYLGSDDGWAYFDCRGDESRYRKVHSWSIRLKHTFPFGQGKPYRVDVEDLGARKSGD